MRAISTLAVSLVIAALGCGKSVPHVVTYAALDQEFSEPIFRRFESEQQFQVRPVFDTEATKSVGLFGRLVTESVGGRARCDLFWNNEILNTLRLKQKGLLRPIKTEHGQSIPAAFKASDATWFGFAARARVLLVNTNLISEAETPRSIFELSDQRWRGTVGIAKPLFGTTATHATCLFACLGPGKAREFFLNLKKNDVRIMSGNKQVALSVAGGSLTMGLTDTDDAILEVERGAPVRIVYLDSQPDELGTLFIPNTLCALKNSPNPSAADRLADFLLSPAVETELARGASAQIPLNPAVTVAPRVATPRTIKAMDVDWEKAVDHWDTTARFIAEQFAAP